MTWQLYILASIVLFSANSVLHRWLMKNNQSDPYAQTLVFYGMGGIIALAISMYRGGFQYQIPRELFPYFMVLAIFCTLAPVLAFHTYKQITSSEATILFSSQRLWMVIGAFIFLQESFSVNKLWGMLIILLGIGIASWRRGKFMFNRGALFALVAAFSYAVADLTSFFILRNFDAASFTVYVCFIPVIFLLLLKPKTVTKLRYYMNPKYAATISAATINDTLATLAVYYAYQLGRNAAQITPLISTQIVLSVILAVIFLKEYDHIWQKILGAVVVMSGVVLVL